MKNNKYLENKIGLVEAMVAGHCMGITYVARGNKDYAYTYEAGAKVREMIRKEITEVFRHGYKLGKSAKV